MKVPAHRKWMDKRIGPDKKITNEFVAGVFEFVDFACAQDQYRLDGIVRCPCKKCKCMQFHEVDLVKVHLCKKGFMSNYYYWTNHGEVSPPISQLFLDDSYYRSSGLREDFNKHEQIVMDAAGPSIGAYTEREGFGYKEQMNEDPKSEAKKRRRNEGTWIPPHVRAELDRQLQQDPKWLEKQRKNTDNRKFEEGLSKHTGGSIPALAHKKKLKQQLSRDPQHCELFTQLHMQKAKWVSTKADQVADAYMKAKSESESQQPQGEELIDIQSDNRIYLDVVGGASKKKRISGLGSEAASDASSLSTSAKSYSQLELENMRKVVETLSAQVIKQQDLINTILHRLDTTPSGSS